MIKTLALVMLRPWVRALYFIFAVEPDDKEELYYIVLCKTLFWCSAIFLAQCIDQWTVDPELPYLCLISLPVGLATIMLSDTKDDFDQIHSIRLRMEAQRGDISQV